MILSRRKKNRGFSLVEISILLIIVGLLAAAAIDTYRDYLNRVYRADVEALITTKLKTSISNFVMNEKRFPCPADPTLAPSNINSGVENCLQTAPGAPRAVGTCSGRVCQVAGMRDVSGNGVNEQVLVGAVPYATLGISLKDSVDPWNNKLTYAVTYTLTQEDKTVPFVFGYNPSVARGVISIRGTSQNASTGVVSPIGNTANADGLVNAYDFIVLSHGPNGKGAYTYNGALKSSCTGVEADVENCDYDSTFVNAQKGTGIQSRRPGANYFDDLETMWEITKDEDKWVYSSADSIKTKTNHRVGIGTQTPADTLHVVGNLRAGRAVSGGAGLPATGRELLANEFCSPDGDCFPSEVVGGVGINCGATASGLITGFADNDVICARAVNASSVAPATCPGDEWVTGYDAAGNIQCAHP